MTISRGSEGSLDTPTDVVVGVCTFKRNEQLRTLVQALVGLARRSGARYRLSIVVVDDDPAGGAKPVLDVLRGEDAVELVYRHCGSANLTSARNTVIEEGLARAPWLVFIDDDCLPDDAWLDHLLAVQARTGADMVTGHVVYRTRPGAPRWLMDEPFCDLTAYEDGEEPEFGNTANVLLSTAFLSRTGVRFRPSLGLTGGEDMTFYADSRQEGAVLRYSAHSVVFEELTASRERLGYHLHRQYWLGNNMVVINRHTHRESMSRLFLRGAKRTVWSLLQPVRRARRGEPVQLRWWTAYALQGVGLMLGVLGVTVRHRP